MQCCVKYFLNQVLQLGQYLFEGDIYFVDILWITLIKLTSYLCAVLLLHMYEVAKTVLP